MHLKKNTPETFNEWKINLIKRKDNIKVKKLFPHEIIYKIRINNRQNTICEEKWKILQNQVKKIGNLEKTLCVSDVSASMYYWNDKNIKYNFLPIDISISLGLLISNCIQSKFNNHIITFSTKPSFHIVNNNDSLFEKWKQLKHETWGGNINLQVMFDLILNQAIKYNLSQKDIPERIIIISDMKFDQSQPENIYTNFELIDKKYHESNYKRPNIIFWNVNCSYNDYSISIKDNGISIISGFSLNILKSVINTKKLSPHEIVKNNIYNDRYKPILEILNI